MDLQKLKKKLNTNIELVLKRLNVQYEVFGPNIYATCPAHEASDNPRAFSFSVDKGIWKCWTRGCQEHYKNDIFGLIRGALSNIEGSDVGFAKTIAWSCELLNIKNKNFSINSQEEEAHNDFVDIVKTLSDQENVIAYKPIELEALDYPSKYFISRGFDKKTLEHFMIGDCNIKGSKMYDRAVIPIHDDCGNNIVGIIGRTTKEYKQPKFLFYPSGFVKTGLLYNYHRAVETINQSNTVFLVEGQGDVWKLYEAGISNAVSIFGKTLSKEQENKLSRLPITKVVILTDNDQAGRESKVQLQRQLGRMYKLYFPRMNAKDVGEMSVEQIKTHILPQIQGLP